MWLKVCVLVSLVILVKSTKKSNILPGRSGTVHLFEWMYRDIQNECLLLSDLGYGAILVSPVQEGTVTGMHTWWERFQPVSLKIATRSGGEDEFLEMSEICNGFGIRVYVEVIINHMGVGGGQIIGYGGSVAYPETLEFPDVPFTSDDFNDFCFVNDEVNMDNSTLIRNCRWIGLPDLNYKSPNVREKVKEFLNKLIYFGVAGFRVQACMYMWPEDLVNLFNELDDLNTEYGFPPGSRPEMMCEIRDLGKSAVSKKEYTGFAKITEQRYAELLYYSFSGRKALAHIHNHGKNSDLVASEDAIVFIDNFEDQHMDMVTDTISFKTPRVYKIATAYLLAFPYGQPSILSSYYYTDMNAGPPCDTQFNILEPSSDEFGQCVNGWVCEHRWPEVVAMIQFRNVVEGTRVSNRADNGQNQIAFCRGNKGFIAINGEITINMKVKLKVCVPPGIYCDVITGGKVNGQCVGKQIEVDENSKTEIFIPYEAEVPVLAFHIESKL